MTTPIDENVEQTISDLDVEKPSLILEQEHHLDEKLAFEFDPTYAKHRQLLIIQFVCMVLLVLLKYVSPYTRFKLKGCQSKLYGCLILTQCILMHQRVDITNLWTDFQFKELLDFGVVAGLFVLGLLHMIRLNHFIP